MGAWNVWMHSCLPSETLLSLYLWRRYYMFLIHFEISIIRRPQSHFMLKRRSYFVFHTQTPGFLCPWVLYAQPARLLLSPPAEKILPHAEGKSVGLEQATRTTSELKQGKSRRWSLRMLKAQVKNILQIYLDPPTTSAFGSPERLLGGKKNTGNDQQLHEVEGRGTVHSQRLHPQGIHTQIGVLSAQQWSGGKKR